MKSSRASIIDQGPPRHASACFSADHLKRSLDTALTKLPNLVLAGPAPAPLLRAETYYRYQIMLRTPHMSRLSRQLANVKKHVTPHVWRHTCATHLVKNDANLRHVQDILGHRSLNTTERYLWLTITDLKEAHRKFHPRERGGASTQS